MKHLLLLLFIILATQATAAESKLAGTWIFDAEATVDVNLALYQAMNPGMTRAQLIAAQRVVDTAFTITAMEVVWTVGGRSDSHAIVGRWDDGFGEVFLKTEYLNAQGDKSGRVFSFLVEGDALTHYGRAGQQVVVNRFKRGKP